MDPLQADIDKATRRAAHYWVEDGLQEALVGVFIVLIGLFVSLEGALSHASRWRPFLAVGFPVFVIALGLLVRRLVMSLKDRYVHPRTGYVSFQRHSRRAGWASGAVGGLVAFLVVVASRAPGLLSWLPALQGMLFAAAFLYAARKVGLARFSVEGLLAALVGLGVALLRLDNSLASGLVFAWTGTAMTAAGLLAFRSYLRQSPRGNA